MMRWWCRFLPVAFVAWYARRNCQRVKLNGRHYAIAFDDVLIRAIRESEE